MPDYLFTGNAKEGQNARLAARLAPVIRLTLRVRLRQKSPVCLNVKWALKYQEDMEDMENSCQEEYRRCIFLQEQKKPARNNKEW